MSNLETNLQKCLDGLAGETVYFYPNPGNSGDSMIACATFQLFSQAGIDWRPLTGRPGAWQGQTVIYGGGGNLVPDYTEGRQALFRLAVAARRLIVLPHTVVGNEDLLAGCRGHVEIFCREPETFTHVRRHVQGAQVFLSHDLALSLDAAAILRRPPRPALALLAACMRQSLRRPEFRYAAPSWKKFLAAVVRGQRLHRRSFPGDTLNGFRTDSEALPALPRPEDNVDVSMIFAAGTQTPAVAYYATWQLLHFLKRFTTIRTDRLHVAIAAALLGKSVEFFPNRYFKCRAVYLHSLAARFPQVAWHDPASPAASDANGLRRSPPVSGNGPRTV